MEPLITTPKLFAYDFNFTVLFPGGEDAYELVYQQICMKAIEMLRDGLEVQVEGVEYPVTFMIQKVDEETKKAIPKGVVCLSTIPEGFVEAEDGVPVFVVMNNAICRKRIK